MASCTHIDHQIQSYLDGELAHADRAIFEHHVAECGACAKRLRSHQRLHADLFETYAPKRLSRDLSDYVISHLPDMEALPVDVQRLNARAKHPSPMRERLFRLMPIAAAALVLVLAVLLQRRWPTTDIPSDAIGVVAAVEGTAHRIAAETGARSRTRERVWMRPGDTIETDGNTLASILTLGPSELRLGPDTALRIEGERKVTLEHGRIYLDVAQSARMFKVHTPMGDVTVYGTKFEVNADADRTSVTVAEGRVQLSHGENPSLFRMVTANQRAVAEHGSAEIPVDGVDAVAECAWALGIEAGEAVQAYFAQKVQPVFQTHEISGEGGFYLQTEGKPLKALVVSWASTSPFGKYSDYDLFVYAPDNSSVFRARIPGSTFSDPRLQEIEVPNTGNPTKGYSMVFVKLVPVSGSDGGTVDFTSVSGLGMEGR